MDWVRFSLAFVFLAGLGVWLLISAILALRTGRANAAGTIVEREKRPGYFMLTVIVQLAFAATALALLLAILRDRFIPSP